MPQMPDFIAKTLEDGKKPDVLPEPLSIAEIEALDLPDTQWIQGTLLPYPGLVALSGPPESYKTFFALWMAIRASSGLPVFSTHGDIGYTELSGPVPTLFIEEENTMQLFRSRMMAMKRAGCTELYSYVDEGFKMMDEGWRAKVLEFVDKKGIKLIFMDPFSSVMGLKDENSNAEVSVVMDIIRKEFIKRNITVVFIHHPSKGDGDGKSLRGAGDITGKCDVHLTFSVENVTERLINVKYAKMRVADRSKLKDFQIRLDGSKETKDFEFVYVGEKENEFVEERNKLREDILRVFEDGKARSRKELCEELGVNDKGQKFRAVWDYLLEGGIIRKTGVNSFIHKNAE